MSKSTAGVMLEGAIWPILGVLLSGVFVAVIYFRLPILHPVDRKIVALNMFWKRGDNIYGPNFIGLESPCFSNSLPGCFCSVGFKVTTSKDFADYVESFGRNSVPVKFEVDLDRKHQVVGAMLESVGTWPGERFHINERSLGTGFRMIPGQTRGGGLSRNPGDCFPNPAN